MHLKISAQETKPPTKYTVYRSNNDIIYRTLWKQKLSKTNREIKN